jgi:hypothetical protein
MRLYRSKRPWYLKLVGSNKEREAGDSEGPWLGTVMLFECFLGVGDSICELEATRFLGDPSSMTRSSTFEVFSGLGVILR